MSTQQNGLTQNYLALPSVNIASSTNANPIVITTSAPHGMTNGDQCDVNGHEVNVSANGIWIATVLSGTTFSIPVAGVGIGAATGTVQPTSAGTTFAIPSDGVDNEAAASVNTPFEALADRTAMLFATTGAYKLVLISDLSVAANPNVSTVSVVAGTTSWAGAVVSIGGIGFGGGDNGVQVNDIVEVEFSSMADNSSSINDISCSLMARNYAPGATPPGYSRMISSNGLTPTSGSFFPVVLKGNLTVTTSGNADFGIAAWASAGTPTVQFFGDARIVFKIWRATTVPQ